LVSWNSCSARELRLGEVMLLDMDMGGADLALDVCRILSPRA
jgi:hypothetical protein